MDPPASLHRPRPADNRWHDHDMSRRCAKCQRKGLYRTNASGLCRKCIASAPKVLKTGKIRLGELVAAHSRAVLEWHAGGDRNKAAQLLDIDRRDLDAILDAKHGVVPVPDNRDARPVTKVDG